MTEARIASPLLTNVEACVYLRLVELEDGPDDVGRAVRCLHKLVRAGLIRPVKPGREYLFDVDELLRYVHDATDSFTPTTET